MPSKRTLKKVSILFFLSGNFGATGTCAVDDLEALSQVASDYQMWYNVDAAYAGVTAMCPEFRPRMNGVESADSILINGSKWFSTMFNTGFLFLGDKRDVALSLNSTGVYLSNPMTDSGLVVDFKDYHLGLGRPFRSLKVWTTITSFGLEGLRSVLRRHVILAKYLAEKMSSEGSPFCVVVTPEFGLVCFRLKDGTNEDNTKLLELVTKTNKAYLVHTLVEQKVTLRVALASPILTYEDMDQLLELLCEQAALVHAS